jgi:hypothetical protein
MKVRVYPMRSKGRRLPWREIQNGPSYVGTLTSFTTRYGEGTYNAIALDTGTAVEKRNPLPDLFEPVLMGFAPNAFVLRGYERVETPEGTIGVVQEWQCKDP